MGSGGSAIRGVCMGSEHMQLIKLLKKHPHSEEITLLIQKIEHLADIENGKKANFQSSSETQGASGPLFLLNILHNSFSMGIDRARLNGLVKSQSRHRRLTHALILDGCFLDG